MSWIDIFLPLRYGELQWSPGVMHSLLQILGVFCCGICRPNCPPGKWRQVRQMHQESGPGEAVGRPQMVPLDLTPEVLDDCGSFWAEVAYLEQCIVYRNQQSIATTNGDPVVQTKGPAIMTAVRFVQCRWDVALSLFAEAPKVWGFY